MRIGLNLLHTMPEIGSGGWNYIQNLMIALGEHPAGCRYVVFATSASERMIPDANDFEPVIVNLNSLSRFQRVAYENSLLQLLAVKYRLDAMHWFANTHAIINTVPSLVTVYDLQAFQNLYSFSKIKSLYLRTLIPYTARTARMLLPMSATTATELNHILGVPWTKMRVIPPCVNPAFQPAKQEDVLAFRRKYDLPTDFWLYVAHQYPHKNHVGLLRAYHKMKLNGIKPWPLVLRGDPAGAESEITETVSSLSLENDVKFLPRLSEIELPILFSAAGTLVYPSLYEGGGLPVIEAMACGLPVVASDIPAVREFAEDAVCYFDPSDINTMIGAMCAFQTDPDLRKKHRNRGLARAKEFQRHRIGQELVEAYTYVSQKT